MFSNDTEAQRKEQYLLILIIIQFRVHCSWISHTRRHKNTEVKCCSVLLMALFMHNRYTPWGYVWKLFYGHRLRMEIAFCSSCISGLSLRHFHSAIVRVWQAMTRSPKICLWHAPLSSSRLKHTTKLFSTLSHTRVTSI